MPADDDASAVAGVLLPFLRGGEQGKALAAKGLVRDEATFFIVGAAAGTVATAVVVEQGYAVVLLGAAVATFLTSSSGVGGAVLVVELVGDAGVFLSRGAGGVAGEAFSLP